MIALALNDQALIGNENKLKYDVFISAMSINVYAPGSLFGTIPYPAGYDDVVTNGVTAPKIYVPVLPFASTTYPMTYDATVQSFELVPSVYVPVIAFGSTTYPMTYDATVQSVGLVPNVYVPSDTLTEGV